MQVVTPSALCPPNTPVAVDQSVVSSNSPVELGCEEIIPDDILADDESDIEMPSHDESHLQFKLPLHPLSQGPPTECDKPQQVEAFTFSPDECCFPSTQNLYEAALNPCSPGDSLLPVPSSTVSANPPEISPDLFKSNGFPHFILSCQDITGFCCDAIPPLSPGGGAIPSYLSEIPYSNGPPLY